MLEAGDRCADPAPRQGKSPSYPLYAPLDLSLRTASTPLRSLLLGKHPRPPSQERDSLHSQRHLESTTPQPHIVPHEAGFSKRRPRHVPIVLTHNVIGSVLKDLPSQPSSSSTFTATSDAQRGKDLVPPNPQQRPRHIPIIIPKFAQPGGLFAPTPSTSADSTPRASVARRGSSEQAIELIENMSRPTTSDNIDPNTSITSPNDAFAERFKASSSSYLADVNSSGELSLQQAAQDAQTSIDWNARSATHDEYAGEEQTRAGSKTTAPANGTNVTGLVCNIHKSTGKEPHALVGATTTVLGDKLFVFGGRMLSRRRPYLTSEMYELDLIRRHWTKIQATGDVPPPRYFHSMCTLGDTKLICYGGMSPAPTPLNQSQESISQAGFDQSGEMVVMSDIHIYDAPSRKWTHIATAESPPGRYAHCAATLPSSAIFTSTNAPLSAIHHNPPSSVPNQGTLGVALDGSGGAEMIVVGGQDSNNKYIDATSVFNLRSLKWTDTHPLPRSCGAYRSVVTPLTTLPVSRIGAEPDREENGDGVNGSSEKTESASSVLIYSNYNFLDVKLELQVRLPDGSLIEKPMTGQVSPPGLRFPNGEVLDNHFIVSGTYLTSSKHEYALWALDLKTLTWGRIDAGGSVFSQGSWNRGVLWARRNTFVILGNRKRNLVDDYNHRRINFTNICMVDLEAFGLYDNPRRAWPTSSYSSISSPVLPQAAFNKTSSLGGRPLATAAIELGIMAMSLRELADMDILAIGGERIPVNSQVLSRRWGPYFVKLLRESGSFSSLQNDNSSSSDGGTLRLGHLKPSASLASRNSSITITPSITTASSNTPSTLTAMSNNSTSTTTGASIFDLPTPHNLPPSSRPRQLYLPHTSLTIRTLVCFLYTSALPPTTDALCTPQILCSLLQIARPYRIDGLHEATVERIHQILDGRNAAAVFNAAAMAAGGGRGVGTAFGKEGEQDLFADDLQPSTSLTLESLQGQSSRKSRPDQTPSESETDTSSETESSTTASEDLENDGDFVTGGSGRRGKNISVGAEEIWSGGVSCVVGLQKRGLKGLMEGRKMREREKGGGLRSPPTGSLSAATGTSMNGIVGSGGGVGLGIQ